MMRREKLVLLLAVLVLAGAGCSGNDGTVTSTPTPVANARLISVGDETAVLADQLSLLPVALAQGRLDEVSHGNAVFDDACTCWRWSEALIDQFDDPFQGWKRNLDYTVTYLAGGVPREEWAGADEILVDVHTDLSLESYHELEKSYYDSEWAYGVTLRVDLAGDEVVAVTGSGDGSMHGGYSPSASSSWKGFADPFTWEISFDQPYADCPTGTVVLRIADDTAAFAVKFDGTATPGWTARGLGNPTTGAYTLRCGGD